MMYPHHEQAASHITAARSLIARARVQFDCRERDRLLAEAGREAAAAERLIDATIIVAEAAE